MDLNLVKASLKPCRVVNLVKTTASLLLKREKVWGKPPIIMIEPTNQCNLRCPLCPLGVGQLTRERGYMSLDLFKKAIDEIDPAYVYLWNWGEPLLHPKIYDMIQYAADKGVYTKLSTNAHFLDDIAAEKIVTSGLNYLIVSVDGASEETYNKYRENGDFTKVINNLIRVIERKPEDMHVAIQFIVMKHNQHEIPKIKELAKNIDAELMIKTVSIDLIDYDSAIERREAVEEYLPIGEYIREIYLTAIEASDEFCNRPWVSTVINWDGKLTPCCYDYNNIYTLGNISKKPFKEEWNSENYQRFRKTIKKHRAHIQLCRTCPIGGSIKDFLNRFIQQDD